MIDTKHIRRLAKDQEWIGRWYDAGCETLMSIRRTEDGGVCEEIAHIVPLGLVPYLVAVQPSKVSELIDRLEAAERTNREWLRANAPGGWIDNLRAENEALQAKIEQMEKQDPVGEIGQQYTLLFAGSGSITGVVKRHGLKIGDKLYALPGAQPAPSVPEDVMRDAERYRYLRARDDGTAGVGCWIEADGRVCDRGWLYGVQLDSATDSFIEVLAAAPKPEAKP